jgi:hypothetical protein
MRHGRNLQGVVWKTSVHGSYSQKQAPLPDLSQISWGDFQETTSSSCYGNCARTSIGIVQRWRAPTVQSRAQTILHDSLRRNWLGKRSPFPSSTSWQISVDQSRSNVLYPLSDLSKTHTGSCAFCYSWVHFLSTPRVNSRERQGGTINSAITGTCRSCDPQHTARYLAAYEYRFNRRFELEKMVDRLVAVAAKTTPRPI